MVRSKPCAEENAPSTSSLRAAHLGLDDGGAGGGVVSGQPFFSLSQHHAFLSSDHPACQFEYPASQSYGLDDVSAQPMCLLEQHQPFLSADHPASQFEYPAAQSYGSDGAT